MTEPKAREIKLKPVGTDGCKSCETGRVTMFIANDQCMECFPEGYEPSPNYKEIAEEAYNRGYVEACKKDFKELDKYKEIAESLMGAMERIDKGDYHHPGQILLIVCEAIEAARQKGMTGE